MGCTGPRKGPTRDVALDAHTAWPRVAALPPLCSCCASHTHEMARRGAVRANRRTLLRLSCTIGCIGGLLTAAEGRIGCCRCGVLGAVRPWQRRRTHAGQRHTAPPNVRAASAHVAGASRALATQDHSETSMGRVLCRAASGRTWRRSRAAASKRPSMQVHAGCRRTHRGARPEQQLPTRPAHAPRFRASAASEGAAARPTGQRRRPGASSRRPGMLAAPKLPLRSAQRRPSRQEHTAPTGAASRA